MLWKGRLIGAGYGRYSEVNNFCAECGCISISQRAWARKILADAAQEKQEGTQGEWQHESPFSVDPKGKMGHRSVRTKVAREGSETPKEAEMEMAGVVPQEASVEIQSSIRQVIRVESEATQDYVRETLAISQEEAQEMGFVPSVLGEPRGVIYWCDNRCSEEAVQYWQIASMVVEGGGEAHTINSCQQCYNEQLAQQGKQPPTLWQWFLRGMWEYFIYS